jgi:GH24 family phage-related lysozyme (muramidase)
MDMEKLRQQLIIDEGVKYEVYLDHLQLKTVGIGHLCREDEPEFDQPVEMRDSRWYNQVYNRAERLAKRMEAIA